MSTFSHERDFPGDPVANSALSLQGRRFDPWLENEDPACHVAQAKLNTIHFQNEDNANRLASSFGQLVSSGRGSEWIGRAEGGAGLEGARGDWFPVKEFHSLGAGFTY